MRSIALIIVLIAAHFTSGHAQTITFASAVSSPTGNTGVSKANGYLVTLAAGSTDFSYLLSDPITTKVDIYVTLVCNTGPVDIGPVLGTTAASPVTPLLGSAAASGTYQGDIISVSTLGPLKSSSITTTTKSADAYIIAAGQTVRYTIDPTGAGNYIGFAVRDVTANYIQNTPCNANAGASSGTSQACVTLLKASTVQMGFEVLNKGGAVLCVQTQAQWATGNSCDGETTNTASTTCTVSTSTTTYSASTTKCANKIYHNTCYDTCPTGTYVYMSGAGCVECGAALDAKGFCTSTIVLNAVPTSSSSLLRVGQIAAMFVGSIYFVLFA